MGLPGQQSVQSEAPQADSLSTGEPGGSRQPTERGGISYFSGPQRLETFQPLGYPMRMGAPEALELPDYDLVESLIGSGDFDRARAHVEAMHPQSLGMLAFAFEWSLQMIRTCHELAGEQVERECSAGAPELFRADVQLLLAEHGASSESGLAVTEAVALYDRLSPESITQYRAATAAGEPSVLTGFSHRPTSLFESLIRELSGGDAEAARPLLQSYFIACVTRHDAIVTFCSSYPAFIATRYGEALALRVSNQSLKECPGWSSLWTLTEKMSQTELAAFLAEHFRYHCSGPGRRGACTVVEDEEKIRLIFKPCGGGGALRRRLGERVPKLQEASPFTWNRSGEVPIYCSHCALNEQHSIGLYGYPRLVTRFNPDPGQPCEWTLYKYPERISADLCERVGAQVPTDPVLNEG